MENAWAEMNTGDSEAEALLVIPSTEPIAKSRGLATRQPHPTDRRVKVIALTGPGQELARRLQLADTTPSAAFASLSEAEMATLRDLLRKVDAPDSDG